MKHAEKVTKTASTARPVLKGVCHEENGDLVVTDACRLYIAKNSQVRNDRVTIDPKLGVSIEGNYPNTSRLIPDSDSKFTVEFNVVEAFKAAKALKNCSLLSEKVPTLKLTIDEEDKAYLTVNSKLITANYFIGHANVEDKHDITFNGQFLIDGLELFKDVGLQHVTLNSYGSFRPFTIKHNEDLLVLLLPIRTVN